jgi:SHS2 domain-containing protein
MGRAETYEHTADLGLRVFAVDLPDLFQTAAAGLFAVIVDNVDQVRAEGLETVALSSGSTEDLLVDWLNELIFRCETQRRLYSRFDVSLDDMGCRLAATIGGESIDPGRHLLDHEVKAATHHELSVKRDGDGWVAELILDI